MSEICNEQVDGMIEIKTIKSADSFGNHYELISGEDSITYVFSSSFRQKKKTVKNNEIISACCQKSKLWISALIVLIMVIAILIVGISHILQYSFDIETTKAVFEAKKRIDILSELKTWAADETNIRNEIFFEVGNILEAIKFGILYLFILFIIALGCIVVFRQFHSKRDVLIIRYPNGKICFPVTKCSGQSVQAVFENINSQIEKNKSGKNI